MIVKLQKIKSRQKFLKSTREVKANAQQRTIIPTASFSNEILESRRQCSIFKVQQESNCQPGTLCLGNLMIFSKDI